MFIWMIFMIFLYIFCKTTLMIIFLQVNCLCLCSGQLNLYVCELLKVIHVLKIITVNVSSSLFVYHNYYTTLAWFYKFSKFSSSKFVGALNNSDLFLSSRLRRSFISYIPYIPNIFSFLSFSTKSQLLYIYILLEPKRKFFKTSLSTIDFKKLFFFDFRIFSSSLPFYQIYKNFRFFFSFDFISLPDKLFLIGSYDPIKNNFYDSNFIAFFFNVSSSCTIFSFLNFFQNVSIFNLFEIFYNFFFNIFIFYFLFGITF